MEIDVAKIAKTSLKVAGAACVATGVVVVSAVVASGAAVGSVAEGFVQAKKAVTDIFKKEEKYTPIVAESVEENTEEADIVSEIASETTEEVSQQL